MDELSIKLNVAGRMYPLTIDRKDEEFVRKAANKINDDIRMLQDNYAVKDKQDLLAMIAIQLATTRGANVDKQPDPNLINELKTVDDLLSSHLDN